MSPPHATGKICPLTLMASALYSANTVPPGSNELIFLLDFVEIAIFNAVVVVNAAAPRLMPDFRTVGCTNEMAFIDAEYGRPLKRV